MQERIVSFLASLADSFVTFLAWSLAIFASWFIIKVLVRWYKLGRDWCGKDRPQPVRGIAIVLVFVCLFPASFFVMVFDPFELTLLSRWGLFMAMNIGGFYVLHRLTPGKMVTAEDSKKEQ